MFFFVAVLLFFFFSSLLPPNERVTAAAWELLFFIGEQNKRRRRQLVIILRSGTQPRKKFRFSSPFFFVFYIFAFLSFFHSLYPPPSPVHCERREMMCVCRRSPCACTRQQQQKEGGGEYFSAYSHSHHKVIKPVNLGMRSANLRTLNEWHWLIENLSKKGSFSFLFLERPDWKPILGQSIWDGPVLYRRPQFVVFWKAKNEKIKWGVSLSFVHLKVVDGPFLFRRAK